LLVPLNSTVAHTPSPCPVGGHGSIQPVVSSWWCWISMVYLCTGVSWC